MRKSFLKILPIALCVVIFSSCSKLEDFGNTNVNPGRTELALNRALLSNALSQLGAYSANTRQGLYCQYFSETQYTDVSLYALPKLTSTAVYNGPLMDLQTIINNCKSEDPLIYQNALRCGNLLNQIAIARICKVYLFWYVTDAWGDVPYKDALTGVLSNPLTYDTQEYIYKDCIKELTEAIAQFNTAGTAFDPTGKVLGDIIYQGSTASWARLANSMRMLMSLRLSKIYPLATDYAALEFNKALADVKGHISSNGANFSITYVADNFRNPWYNLYDGRKDFAESEPFWNLIDSLGDSSRKLIYGSTNVPMPYGINRTKATIFTNENTGWAYILASGLRETTSNLVMISAADVVLARAEAAQRGWTAENAQVQYANGIALGFDRWDVLKPGAYVDVLPVVNPLRAIALQQYVASYPNGWFGWANWRRTGYPVLVPAVDATNSSKQIPRRYVYGDPENQLTTDALAVAVARLSGGDTQDSRIWWDKK